MPNAEPASVLDASAVMAHLNEEDGATTVREAMKDGAAISVANWAQGLSLADRACLALAARLGVPALTADSIWAQAEAPAEVKLIR